MRTGTIDAPKDNTNHSVWRRLSVIAAAVSVAVLTVAAAPARAQTGPILNEVTKLLALDGDPIDEFGHSVALSGDTVLVGAFNNDDNGNNSGSAYVFVRNANGLWAQQFKLLASDGAENDRFGISVAINDDTALIGARLHDDNGFNSGSAYVFVRNAGGVWTQQTKLLAFDGAAGDNFGTSVAINGDTAVVGAHYGDGNVSNSGAAYVFVRDAAGVWKQQTKLLASDGAADDFFGESVAFNGDTAIIGAYGDDDNGSVSGSAYVFVRDVNGVWKQHAKLLASDGAAGDLFGLDVAISGDTALIGARGDDDNGSASGSAYVFVRDAGGVWTQQAKLLASDGAAGDWFGLPVAISVDAVVVGALGDDDNGMNSGSAYVFTCDDAGVWSQQNKLLASDGAQDDFFGISVALSGATAIVGAYGDNDNGPQSGSAYVFNLMPADLNGDGIVDDADLASLLAQWGTNGAADLNGDGVVDGADLATLLTNWGPV